VCILLALLLHLVVAIILVLRLLALLCARSSFDWRFAMPDYQKAAVAGYLQIASKLPGFPPSGKQCL
jgi:hypothetical protein